MILDTGHDSLLHVVEGASKESGIAEAQQCCLAFPKKNCRGRLEYLACYCKMPIIDVLVPNTCDPQV